jgi:hypothetical protein
VAAGDAIENGGSFADDNRLQYGRAVVLEDTKTHWSSPPLIIRKADRSSAAAGDGSDEPVSELHKVRAQQRTMV